MCIIIYTTTYNYLRLPEHLFFRNEYPIYVSICGFVPNGTLYNKREMLCLLMMGEINLVVMYSHHLADCDTQTLSWTIWTSRWKLLITTIDTYQHCKLYFNTFTFLSCFRIRNFYAFLLFPATLFFLFYLLLLLIAPTRHTFLHFWLR